MAKNAGGGINSRVVKSVSVRNGSAARVQNPRGVSQIGSNIGNHATGDGKILRKAVEPVRGSSMPGVKLGNQVAAETVCGVGGSRSVMRSGSQGQQGPAAGKVAPQGRDILSGFGPDVPGRR
jgi:hypothetical protein